MASIRETLGMKKTYIYNHNIISWHFWKESHNFVLNLPPGTTNRVITLLVLIKVNRLVFSIYFYLSCNTKHAYFCASEEMEQTWDIEAEDICGSNNI